MLILFYKKGKNSSPIEFIIPREGVLKDFNGGKGGIAHIAFEVDDVEAVRQEMEKQKPGCMLEKRLSRERMILSLISGVPVQMQEFSLNMSRP